MTRVLVKLRINTQQTFLRIVTTLKSQPNKLFGSGEDHTNMKYSTPLLLASASWASALTQQCSGTAVNEGGNWFCGKISHILYEGIVGKGSFKAVTGMGSNGECHMEDKPYGGPLAPLDEDVSSYHASESVSMLCDQVSNNCSSQFTSAGLSSSRKLPCTTSLPRRSAMPRPRIASMADSTATGRYTSSRRRQIW